MCLKQLFCATELLDSILSHSPTNFKHFNFFNFELSSMNVTE